MRTRTIERNDSIVRLLFVPLLLLAAAAPCAARGHRFRRPRRGSATCPLKVPRQPRAQDELWHVCTRHLGPCPAPGCGPADLEYRRFDACAGWQPATAEEFFATADPEFITTVFIHGNRVEDWRALLRGHQLYGLLSRGACQQQRIRHVIWSWPSSPIPGRIKPDARIKGLRTPAQSHLLGQWLAEFQPDARVSLVGYSYGARIILGGLHLLAGGELYGRVLPVSNRDTVFVRAVLLATAEDNTSLRPGCRNELAASKLDQALITWNRCDPVLKRYRRAVCDACAAAIGLTGLAAMNCPADGDCRLDQLNVTHVVGRRHSLVRHLESRSLACRIRKYALWEYLP